MTLHKLIAEEIRSGGPMTVERYMALALMHPEFGYYQTRKVFGAEGDFITAPEISQIFGELIGAWMADQWMRLGSKQAVLMELGPGRGTLMKDLLRATRRLDGFHERIQVRMVEASAGLRERQAEALKDEAVKIEWQPTLEPLPEMPLFVVANEFFDALPVRQFTKTRERRVSEMNGKLAFVEAPSPNPLPQGERAFLSSPSPLMGRGATYTSRGEGEIHETCEAAIEIMQKLAAHIAKFGGAVLVADYGYLGGSQGDTLQAMREHKFHPVLENPGEADITAHVDFDALKTVAESPGLQARISTQSDWLRRMGAELRAIKLCENKDEKTRQIILSGLERLMSPTQMGELFKVMELTSSSPESPLRF